MNLGGKWVDFEVDHFKDFPGIMAVPYYMLHDEPYRMANKAHMIWST